MDADDGDQWKRTTHYVPNDFADDLLDSKTLRKQVFSGSSWRGRTARRTTLSSNTWADITNAARTGLEGFVERVVAATPRRIPTYDRLVRTFFMMTPSSLGAYVAG